MPDAEIRADAGPKPHRRRRWLIWAGAVVLLAGALGAIDLIIDPVSAVRLERRLRALRRAGGPVTLSDWAKTLPAPAPDRNAAFLYAEAGKLLAEVILPPDLRSSLPYIGIGKRPPLGEPLPLEMAAAAAEYLVANEQVLALVHKAAALPECRFAVLTVDEDIYPPARRADPYYLRCLLDIECQKRMDDGQFEESVESIGAALRLAYALRSNAPIYGSGSSNADDFTRKYLDMLARLLARHTPSSPTLRRLEEALRAQEDPTLIERGLIAERAWAGDSAWKTYTKNCLPHRVAPFERLELGGCRPVTELLHGFTLPRLPEETDRLWHLLVFDAAIEPFRTGSPTRVFDALRAARQRVKAIPDRCGFAALSAWVVEHATRAGLEVIARSESARVALAALRFRAAKGKLPDQLSQLVPEFLDAIPMDPYSGDPLRYLKEPEGLVVYAVGEDGQDDGGWIDYISMKGTARDIGFRVRSPKR